MAADEVIHKLAKLSQRERQVLGMVCSGLMYKDIAQKLFLSLPTIKAVMGRVYVKLGLDQLDKAERTKAIFQVYCTRINDSAILDKAESPEKNEPLPLEENVPIPLAIMKMVDEDEIVVIPSSPRDVIYIPDSNKKEGTDGTGPRPIVVIIAGVIAFVCLVAGVLIFRDTISPGLGATGIVTATEGVVLENTAIIPPNPVELLPSATPIIQEMPAVATDPPQPTAQILPTITVPSIPLPFSDNFSNGANSAWNSLVGSWLTADGRYTTSNADSNWSLSVIDDPGWMDYRLKVNIIRSHPGAFAEGEEVIIVRYLNSESKFLVFYLNTLSQAGWAIYDGKHVEYISGHSDISAPSQFDLEIEAVGNQFTARINGMLAQQISISGYGNGGVGLGSLCQNTPCSSFDDFQLTSAP